MCEEFWPRVSGTSYPGALTKRLYEHRSFALFLAPAAVCFGKFRKLILSGGDIGKIFKSWEDDEKKFKEIRQPFLIY